MTDGGMCTASFTPFLMKLVWQTLVDTPSLIGVVGPRISYVMTRPPLHGSEIEVSQCCVAGARWGEQWRAHLALTSAGPENDDSVLAALFGHRAVIAQLPVALVPAPAPVYRPPHCGVRIDVLSSEKRAAVALNVASAVAPRTD